MQSGFRQIALTVAAAAFMVCGGLAHADTAAAEIVFSEPQRFMATPDAYEEICGWSPDGTSLLYVARDSGGAGLWVSMSNPETHQVLRMGTFQHASFSPDGTRVSASVGYPGSHGELRWMYTDDNRASLPATLAAQVTGSVTHFSGGEWLPDGQRMAYVDDYGVHVVDTNGQHSFSAGGAYLPPRVSPTDGSLAMVDSGWRAVICPPEGGSISEQVAVLTKRNDWRADLGMSWSKDGERLVWAERSTIFTGGDEAQRLWVTDRTGQSQRLLAEFPSPLIRAIQAPSFSYDGRYLAFWGIERATGAARLWVMSADGGEPTPLNDFEYAANLNPWSPVQNRLAITGAEGNPFTVDVSGDAPVAPAESATIIRPESSASGWYPSAPQIELSGPGGRMVFYQWNGTDPDMWLPAFGPISAPDGDNVLHYCLDAPGSVETLRAERFQVDSVAPVMLGSVQCMQDQTSIWFNMPYAEDWESGLAGYELWEGDTLLDFNTEPLLMIDNSERRNYDLRLNVVDNAGNRSEPVPYLLSMPPVPLASLQLSGNTEPNANGWFGGSHPAPMISIAQDPEYSMWAERYYRWDTEPWQFFGGLSVPFGLPEGIHRLEYYQYDDWNQDHQIRFADFKCDYTGPTEPVVTATPLSSSQVRVDMSGSTDEVSGIDYYRITDNRDQVTTTTVDSMTFTDLPADAEQSYMVQAVDRAGNLSYVASATTRTLAESQPIVPSGTNVQVDLGQVILNFENVTGAGDATAAAISPRHEPVGGLKHVSGLYYDIHPTASFTGFCDVTLRIPPEAAADFDSLRLYHWDGSAWEDITTGVDPTGLTITGRTDSFSDFSVMDEDAAPPVVSTPATAPWTAPLAVALALGAAVALRRRARI